MKPLEEAADLVANVVPAARSARWIAYAIAIGVGALLLGLVFWWFFIHPQQLAREAGQAKVDATLGTAAGDIATRAIPQINEATRQKVEVDVRIQKDQADVRKAPDAGVEIRGVSDAVRRANCLYDLNAADPACQSVHEDPAGIGPARPDAGTGRQPD